MPPLIPWYAAPLVIFVDLVAAGLVTSLFRGQVRRVVGGTLALWFVLAWLASAPTAGADPAAIPLSFALFTAGPITVALVAFAVLPAFRRSLDTVSAAELIAFQFYRNIGAIFLALYAVGSLPAHFALPAAWGDIFIGMTAPLVALAVAKRARGARPLAIGWNIFGLLDLAVAVGMGSGKLVPLLAPGLGPDVPPATAMTYFPLVLIPTFAVPLAVLLHIAALRAVWTKKAPLPHGRLQTTL